MFWVTRRPAGKARRGRGSRVAGREGVSEGEFVGVTRRREPRAAHAHVHASRPRQRKPRREHARIALRRSPSIHGHSEIHCPHFTTGHLARRQAQREHHPQNSPVLPSLAGDASSLAQIVGGSVKAPARSAQGALPICRASLATAEVLVSSPLRKAPDGESRRLFSSGLRLCVLLSRIIGITLH